MTNTLIAWFISTTALLLAATCALAAAPVAKVASYTGNLEYSRPGGEWRVVTRPNKYLLPGYALRTGGNGSAEIQVQASGETRAMGASSVVQINDTGLELVSGELSPPDGAAGSYVQSMYNKFLTSQRYTTVRRSSNGDPTRFKTARALTVSATYPDLVWEHIGPKYSYRVDVDGRTHEVAGDSGADMIRFSLPAMPAGLHRLTVAVVENGEVVHTSRPTNLTWLSKAENARYLARERTLAAGVHADPIVLAAFQSDSGFKVAALDTYRAFFSRYPDENEVRPMLAQAYAELHMSGLQSREASTYQELALGAY